MTGVQTCALPIFPLTADWGRPIAPEQVETALRQHPELKAVVIVHAETSTGVQQPMEDIARLVKDQAAQITSGIANTIDMINDTLLFAFRKPISPPATSNAM